MLLLSRCTEAHGFPFRPGSAATTAWLSEVGLGPPADAAEVRARRLRGEEEDVSRDAEVAAWRVCDMALEAVPPAAAELFDEERLEWAASANAARRAAVAAAREQLGALGVCDEHLDALATAPLDELLPLLHEMSAARAVGASAAARLRRPADTSYGAPFRWPTATAASVPPPATSALALVVVARHRGEDVTWLLERLPPRVDYHVMDAAPAKDAALPAAKQTLVGPPPPPPPEPTSGRGFRAAAARTRVAQPPPPPPPQRTQRQRQQGSSPGGKSDGKSAEAAPPAAAVHAGCASASYLRYLERALANEELIEVLKDPKAAAERVLVVSTEREHADDSIQAKIVAALRQKAERVMDLFKRWDTDRSGTVDKEEFARALRYLRVEGTDEEYGLLFDSWDVDGGGTMSYTELLAAMHAGRRYDSFAQRKAAPPIPPLLVFTDGAPLQSAPRFFDDLALLVRAAAGGRPLPRFIPLGTGRCGERLLHCDPSGAPHSRTLLPIGAAWRGLYGVERPLPLWLPYTQGAVFGISRASHLHIPWMQLIIYCASFDSSEQAVRR